MKFSCVWTDLIFIIVLWIQQLVHCLGVASYIICTCKPNPEPKSNWNNCSRAVKNHKTASKGSVNVRMLKRKFFSGLEKIFMNITPLKSHFYCDRTCCHWVCSYRRFEGPHFYWDLTRCHWDCSYRRFEGPQCTHPHSNISWSCLL